jgi:hypothetical protein
VPSIHQVLSWAKQEIAKGNGECHTNHITIIEHAVKDRQKNEKRSTRIAWDCKDPDCYSAWHKERERWMEAAKKNPVLATDAMIVALKAYSPEGMQVILENLQQIGL